MLTISKLTLGIQPAAKMFRVQSAWGAVFDSVFAVMGTNALGSDYFNSVTTLGTRDRFQARNEEKGNFLTLSADNIVFTKSLYNKDGYVKPERFVSEFLLLWQIVQKSLEVTNIRRIGMVAEHRVSISGDPSAELMSKLVKLPVPDRPAKFSLNFESRLPVVPEGAKAVSSSGSFVNLICQIYDSELDSEVPERNAINLNLDVQRYYAPLLKRDADDQVKILSREFEKHWREFQVRVKALGFYSDEE